MKPVSDQSLAHQKTQLRHYKCTIRLMVPLCTHFSVVKYASNEKLQAAIAGATFHSFAHFEASEATDTAQPRTLPHIGLSTQDTPHPKTL